MEKRSLFISNDSEKQALLNSNDSEKQALLNSNDSEKQALLNSNDSEKQALLIFTDGGARGNPGPAAIGFMVKDNRGQVLVKLGKYIGRATNNVAEYQAVIEALQWIISNIKYQISNIQFFLDSKLVVNQLNGRFKIKDAKLKNLVIKVRCLEKEINGKIFYHFIPRQKNHHADFLVNQALDKKIFKLFT